MMNQERAKTSFDRLLFLFSLATFLLVLAFPAVTARGVRSGLDLSFRTVLPAVFPALVLTDLLFSRSGGVIESTLGRLLSRVFRVSPRGAVSWVVGLLAGFPVGAITVARDVRAGRLAHEEGEYLLAFVNNTGPAFLVGGVGLGLFGSVGVGWTLWLLQIPISVLVGLLFRRRRPFLRRAALPPSDGDPDPVASIVRACETSVRTVGFVCFFSTLSALLSIFLTAEIPSAFATVLLEVGNGAVAAARLSFPFPALGLSAFAVCFSGLSVHFQTISALRDAGLSPKLYLKGKIIAGLLGFVFATLFCLTK